MATLQRFSFPFLIWFSLKNNLLWPII
jgi:hypothetical protein